MSVDSPTKPIAQEHWAVATHQVPDMPPMAWVLRTQGSIATIVHGRRVSAVHGGVFEGTWVGPTGLDGLLQSTAVYGSGVVAAGESLLVIPPSHMLEAVYVSQRNGVLWASNSLTGLLTAAELELDPSVDYAAVFAQSGDGTFRFDVPTLTEPVQVILYEPMSVAADGSTSMVLRPREVPFATFDEYRSRLSAALESSFANAPGFEPISMISSGYDSAAMTILAREVGCHRAITVPIGKPVRGNASLSDSGEGVARVLGLEVETVERLGYMDRADLAEAEFLATGMSGEDVVFSGMERGLVGGLLVSGFYGDGMWWSNVPNRPLFWRLEQAGASLGEFRLRVGFVHVPLPWFGATERTSIKSITTSAEMARWVLGMHNDRPIPRRILEDAGIPRGSFADAKRATSAAIHSDGLDALAAATVTSLNDFASSEGHSIAYRRQPFPRWRRYGLHIARRAHSRRAYSWLEKPRRKHVRHQPEFGNLLLRWAVSVLRPRYAGVRTVLSSVEDVGRGR